VSRLAKVVASVILVVTGLAGWAFFLTTQGLDKADAWSQVIGFFVSTLIGVSGLVLGWLAWRQSASAVGASGSAPVGSDGARVDRSGRVEQANRGGVNVGNTGVMGDVEIPGEQR
jgi:hypothetical protein